MTAVVTANLSGGHSSDILTAEATAPASQLGVWSWSAGALQEAGTYALAGIATPIATGDIAGNGGQDVVVGSHTASGAMVTVFPDSGGSLGASTTTPVGGADSVAVGNMNADGRADVVARPTRRAPSRCCWATAMDCSPRATRCSLVLL